MAYVVGRPGGRFEVRESRLGPKGPRSRTLASFRVLDDTVLAHAAARAETGFDASAVRAAARRAGAPIASGAPADRAARALLHELRAGHVPTPGLRAVVAAALGSPAAVPDSVGAMAGWVGASTAERGDALRDLLLLADRLPAPPRRASAFPGLR
jgi:hypothetical protein